MFRARAASLICSQPSVVPGTGEPREGAASVRDSRSGRHGGVWLPKRQEPELWGARTVVRCGGRVPFGSVRTTFVLFVTSGVTTASPAFLTHVTTEAEVEVTWPKVTEC